MKAVLFTTLIIRQVTLHQGAIEQIFLDNMQDMDLQVDRSTIPIAIEVNENSVSDPDAHPVKAGFTFHYFETSLTLDF